MTLITVNTTTLNRLVKDLVKAEIEESWAGSQPKEDRPYYKQELAEARAALKNYIEPKEVKS